MKLVTLKTHLKDYILPREGLLELSERTSVAEEINLCEFDVISVQLFVQFVQCPEEKLIITFEHFKDLYDISSAFGTKQLTDALEEHLLSEANSLSCLCLCLKLSEGKSFPDVLQKKLLLKAAANFKRLIDNPHLHEIPPDIMSDLLERCDLNVQNELQVAMGALNWLKNRTDALDYFYGIVCAVRVGRMSNEDREAFEDNVSGMTNNCVSNASQFLPLLHILFNENDSVRCCVLVEHVEKGFTRCGEIPENARKIVIRNSLMFDKPLEIKFGSKKDEQKDQMAPCNINTPGWLCNNVKMCARSAPKRSTRKERREKRRKEERRRKERDTPDSFQSQTESTQGGAKRGGVEKKKEKKTKEKNSDNASGSKKSSKKQGNPKVKGKQENAPKPTERMKMSPKKTKEAVHRGKIKTAEPISARDKQKKQVLRHSKEVSESISSRKRQNCEEERKSAPSNDSHKDEQQQKQVLRHSKEISDSSAGRSRPKAEKKKTGSPSRDSHKGRQEVKQVLLHSQETSTSTSHRSREDCEKESASAGKKSQKEKSDQSGTKRKKRTRKKKELKVQVTQEDDHPPLALSPHKLASPVSDVEVRPSKRVGMKKKKEKKSPE